jgi:hypothetical protein
MMANRNPASEKQRDFFAFLARAPHLVLSMRERSEHDAASVNAHGRFQLLDRLWPGSEDVQNHDRETLLAFAAGSTLEMADTDEPVVHLHVDWSRIKFAWMGERPKTLIGTDKEIVFCTDRNKESRVFWFNLRDWDGLPGADRWGRECWIDLESPAAKGGV